MNYKMVGFVLGRIFWIEAVLMLCPMACSALFGEWDIVLSFLWPALVLVALGMLLGLRQPRNTTIYARDGLVIVRWSGIDVGVWGTALYAFPARFPLSLMLSLRWFPALPPRAPPSSPTWKP